MTEGNRPAFLYRSLQALGRGLWSLGGGTTHVSGLDNIPESGPFLLISNHQSFLDPILTQAVIRRPVHAMSKSSQFNVPVIGWIMRRINTFPVRRFQIDPQAVRLTLRLLRAGQGVAIYIEGERSWDAQLQEPRRGTIRLALRAGVPVIPVAVSGTYDVWPRWDRRPRPGPVSIRFLPPVHLPQLRGTANRAAVDETAGLLMGKLREAVARD